MESWALIGSKEDMRTQALDRPSLNRGKTNSLVLKRTKYGLKMQPHTGGMNYLSGPHT